MNTQSTPHRCPVCNGAGTVRPGFYDHGNPLTMTNAVSEQCRSCFGSGIVWSMNVQEVTEITVEMPDEDDGYSPNPTPWRA